MGLLFYIFNDKTLIVLFAKALHALDKGAEGFNLCPKQQISKLSVGKENNEEHDGEAQDVFGTATQCGGQLSHGLVETDVFENLEECKENKYKYAYPEPRRFGWESEGDGCQHLTLIQAKNKFTAFMLLYCVCQKARNSKSA